MTTNKRRQGVEHGVITTVALGAVGSYARWVVGNSRMRAVGPH